MATPTAKVVRDAFRVRLESITGTYATGAGKVVWFPFATQLISTGFKTVIGLAKDVNLNTRLTFSNEGSMEVEMPVDLAICTQFQASQDLAPFSQPSPAKNRSDVQDEIAQVVKDKLLIGDLGIPAIVKNVTIPDEDHSYENTFTEGWAVVFMRVIVTYQHPISTS